MSHTLEVRNFPRGRSFVAAAVDAISRAGGTPVDMEYFTARDSQPADYCRHAIDQVDVYVGIIGFRYGSPVTDRPDLSHTELEFEMATERKIPRLILLLDDTAEHLGIPPVDLFDQEYGARQAGFRRRLQGAGLTVARVQSPTDLELRLYQALTELTTACSGQLGPEQAGAPGDSVSSIAVAVGRLPLEVRGLDELLAGGPRTAMFQLPPDVSEFTGREDSLARIEELTGTAAPMAIVISAIAGKGGVGKTTLATHAAHRLASRFPDGQLYVNLRGADAVPLRPFEVLVDLLSALGVDAATIPPTLTAREAVYRTKLAGRRVLILLDNAADEAQVRPLLPGTATCAVLITSRAPLAGLAGVSTLHLDVLEPGEAVALLGKICGADRVEAEAAAAERIVTLCGCLPLAVRIAGAKLAARPHWPLERLAQRLADVQYRLDELSAGDAEVRTTFLISYRGQPEGDRNAFCLLGLVDAETFSAWMLASLIGTTERTAEEHLDRLMMAQLVEPAGGDAAGQLRYRLHDLLRDLARERVADEYDEASRERALRGLLETSLALANRADEELHPGGSRHGVRAIGSAAVPAKLGRGPGYSSLRWFIAERASLLAAIGQAYRVRLWSLCWELADAMSLSLEYQWRMEDLLTSHELALEAAHRLGNASARAALLHNVGQANLEVARWDRADAQLEEAVSLFASVHDDVGRADTLISAGILHFRIGSTARAHEEISTAVRLFGEQENHRGLGWAMWAEGMFLESEGRLAVAATRAQAALEIFEHAGELRGVTAALRVLADVYRGLASSGHPMLAIAPARTDLVADARRCCERSLKICAELPEPMQAALTNRCLGELEILDGRLEAAEGCLDAARQALEGARNLRVLSITRCSHAVLRHAQGRFHEALELAQRSCEELERLGDRERLAWTLSRLGFIWRSLGNGEAAAEAWERARRLNAALGRPLATADLDRWTGAG